MLNAGQDARTLAGIPVAVRWAPVAPAAANAASDEFAEPDGALSLLSPFELDRFRSLRPEAATTFLAGRRLLRELVSTVAAVDAAEVVVEARCPFCGGPHGRPAVIAPPSATSLQLGLSHTAGAVVAVAAWDHAVGVDVERADAVAAPERDRAIATVAGASGDDPLAHWTRVEAVLKADGRGLRVDPRTVSVTTVGDVIEARIDRAEGAADRDTAPDPAAARYVLATLDLGPWYTASVAVRS